MRFRVLTALLVSACGAPPAPPPDQTSEREGEATRRDEPSNEEDRQNQPMSDEGQCGVRVARLALARSMPPPNGIVRVTHFESAGRGHIGLLGAVAGDESDRLLLYAAQCVDDRWRFWDPIVVGSFSKVTEQGPGRYERADVQLSSREISGDSRVVEVAWRHPLGPPSEHSVERRSVRWYDLRGTGPTLLAECTTRDLRSIDDSSFVQGHEVRGWRVLPGNPPRLVGDRVAGGGTLRGRTMVWSDLSDQRSLDVSLQVDDPELMEICL